MQETPQEYVITDIRSDPPEFLDDNNRFVPDFSSARRMTIEQGVEIIDGFNKMGETYDSNMKAFMPALIHIQNLID
jgi:hypothetical protein